VDAPRAPDLVGRAVELETLNGLLDRVASGQTAVAVLVGAPGIGKTRLARELSQVAAERGALSLWGAAYEDWTPPYGPWTQALTPFVGGLESEELAGALGDDASVIAAVVPEVATTLSGVGPAPHLGVRAEQARLHNAVVRLLGAAERPVALAIDDLQWADEASVDLVVSAARAASHLLVVGTMRDVELGPVLERSIADLTREGFLERLDVKPLTESESATLLARLGAEPALADRIYDQARGNPFFSEELARHAREHGAGPWTLPAGVRLAVRSRVHRLSSEAGRLLSVASVFTHPFSFAALRALAELPETTMLDALDEALAAGLLVVDRVEHETYEFAHALVRQALYDEMNPSRRARLHRRAATALEELGGGADLVSASELATQYHRSAALPGATRGVDHALAGAELAAERFARSEVVRLLRVARDLTRTLDPPRRAPILCRLALAEADALALVEARRTVDEALAALEVSGTDDGQISDFLWSLARALSESGAPESDVRPLVEHGLTLVGDSRDLRWARLELVLRPAEPVVSGRIQAERWLGYDPHAVRIAQSEGTEQDQADTLELMEWRTRGEIDALLERCRAWHEPSARIHALSIAARTLLYNLAAFGDALVVSEELLRESTRVGSVAGTAYALEQIADVQAAFGAFDDAQQNVDRARSSAATLGPSHRIHFIISLVERRLRIYLDADWEEIARHFERAATAPSLPWPWISIQAAGYAALAHARAGASDDAIRLLDDLLPLLESLTPTTLNQNSAVPLAAEAVWVLEDTARAARLRRLSFELIEAGVGDYVLASNELTVARMAVLLDDPAAAETAFARAQEQLRADGRRPLQAMAVVDEAVAAQRFHHAIDLVRLRAAAVAFEGFGMRRWAERALSLVEDAERRLPSGLTRREAEILRLVAAGRTNREIADTLVLSVHTIERHLANSYRKIGARNRADATSFTLRHLQS
jgi:DNA-binding CsgD family transcriptional regulator